MHIYTPYTYLIGWSAHNKWYYGVRYAKNCHPSDLWTKYFTSSKVIQDFRKLNGDPDVIQIRKIFLCKEDAAIWEHKVLRRLRVNLNDKWLNKTYNGCFEFLGPKNTIPGMLAARQVLKGKTYQEIYKDQAIIESIFEKKKYYKIKK